jgi:hypothetical protein
MNKLIKLILPLLLFTLVSNTTFASVSHEGKESKEISYSARKLGLSKEGIQRFSKSASHYLKSTEGSFDLGKLGEMVGNVGRSIWKGKKSVDWNISPRVMGQLQDRFSGVVKIDKRKMLELLENPSAQRLFDTKSNHINVIQEIQGKLVRITVLKDEFKVISTGIMKQNGLKNGITKGRFIPLK